MADTKKSGPEIALKSPPAAPLAAKPALVKTESQAKAQVKPHVKPQAKAQTKPKPNRVLKQESAAKAPPPAPVAKPQKARKAPAVKPAPQLTAKTAPGNPPGEALRRAFAEATSASTKGAFVVNDKMLDAFRAQSEATLDLWRSTLSAPSMSDALRAQTGGVRQVYETATAYWQDVAETTKAWLDDSVRPLRSIWADRFR